MNAIRKRQLPSKPESATSSQERELLWKMCCRCWHHSPNLRSTAENEVSVLSQFINVDTNLHSEKTVPKSRNKSGSKQLAYPEDDHASLLHVVDRLFTAAVTDTFFAFVVRTKVNTCIGDLVLNRILLFRFPSALRHVFNSCRNAFSIPSSFSERLAQKSVEPAC